MPRNLQEKLGTYQTVDFFPRKINLRKINHLLSMYTIFVALTVSLSALSSTKVRAQKKHYAET